MKEPNLQLTVLLCILISTIVGNSNLNPAIKSVVLLSTLAILGFIFTNMFIRKAKKKK